MIDNSHSDRVPGTSCSHVPSSVPAQRQHSPFPGGRIPFLGPRSLKMAPPCSPTSQAAEGAARGGPARGRQSQWECGKAVEEPMGTAAGRAERSSLNAGSVGAPGPACTLPAGLGQGARAASGFHPASQPGERE